MKVIRWILGRLIILLDFIFSPKPILRDKTSQDLVNTITNRYKLYQYYACPFCVKVRRFLRKESINIEFIDAKDELNLLTKEIDIKSKTQKKIKIKKN